MEYDILLWSEEPKLSKAYTFSVADWSNRHTPVWLIARQFVESSQLMKARLPTDLWGIGGSEPACAFKECDWLHVVIRAGSNRRRQNLAVDLFVQEANASDIFRHLFLSCPVHDAMLFGESLEREIIGAAPKWWATEK